MFFFHLQFSSGKWFKWLNFLFLSERRAEKKGLDFIECEMKFHSFEITNVKKKFFSLVWNIGCQPILPSVEKGEYQINKWNFWMSVIETQWSVMVHVTTMMMVHSGKTKPITIVSYFFVVACLKSYFKSMWYWIPPNKQITLDVTQVKCRLIRGVHRAYLIRPFIFLFCFSHSFREINVSICRLSYIRTVHRFISIVNEFAPNGKFHVIQHGMNKKTIVSPTTKSA